MWFPSITSSQSHQPNMCSHMDTVVIQYMCVYIYTSLYNDFHYVHSVHIISAHNESRDEYVSRSSEIIIVTYGHLYT